MIRSPKEIVEVFLGDQSLGEAGPTGGLSVSRLSVGSYQVRARAKREGPQPFLREVQVAANQTTEVVIDIER